MAGPADDNGFAALLNPTPGLVTDLSGRAQASLPGGSPYIAPPAAPAPTPAPIDYSKLNLPAFDPNAAPPHDAAASGMGNFTRQGAAQTAINGLATGVGPVHRMVDFFTGNDQTKAALDAQDQTAQFYARPDVQHYLAANPTFIDAARAKPADFAGVLGQVMNHVSPQAGVTPNGKPIPPEHQPYVAGNAAVAGVDHGAAYAFHAPGEHTEQEFVDATSHLSWNQASKLFSMMATVNPQRQATSDYLNLLAGEHQSAAQKLAEATTKGGMAGADLKAMQDQVAKTRQTYVDALKGLSSPTTYPYGLGQQ